MGTLTALEKLVPVVLAFGCGVLLARRKVVPADSSRVFVDYAFLFAVPCYLFGNIYGSDLGALFDWRAILGYATTAALAVLTIGVLAGLGGQRDPRAIALRIMAGVQVNTAYFAVPVFITLFGNAAPIFPVLLFQVCVLTLVIISIMELGRPVRDAGQGSGPRLLLRAVGASLVTPVVLACNAGILLNLLSLHVPKPLLDGFSFVGDSASPVALFALGLHLGGSGLRARHDPGGDRAHHLQVPGLSADDLGRLRHRLRHRRPLAAVPRADRRDAGPAEPVHLRPALRHRRRHVGSACHQELGRRAAPASAVDAVGGARRLSRGQLLASFTRKAEP